MLHATKPAPSHVLVVVGLRVVSFIFVTIAICPKLFNLFLLMSPAIVTIMVSYFTGTITLDSPSLNGELHDL